MNLHPLMPGKNSSIGQLKIYPNGVGYFVADFVKRFGLENKHLIISADIDDKDKKFLYLTIDESGIEAASFKLKKQKNGSFQVGLARVAASVNLKNKTILFIYTKKIAIAGRPYFVFEKYTDDNESTIQKDGNKNAPK